MNLQETLTDILGYPVEAVKARNDDFISFNFRWPKSKGDMLLAPFFTPVITVEDKATDTNRTFFFVHDVAEFCDHFGCSPEVSVLLDAYS